MQRVFNRTTAVMAGLLILTSSVARAAETTKIVFVAGPKSHGYGSHEHYAGCLLLAKCLEHALPSVKTVVHKNGWPKQPDALRGADAIVVFADGGGRNPLLAHLQQIDTLMKKGVGLACLHYAVQVPKGEAGDYFKQWIGGYYELHWSVNPHWKAQFDKFPDHPVARGLKPFAIEDEWYYHMRFIGGMEEVTPILSAIPPESTRNRPFGPHSGNPAVRARRGMIEHVAWARRRPDGGRGFGFTGGHWHWNWGNDQFRTVVLNGIAWTAGVEIPTEGIQSRTPTFAELEAKLDEPRPAKFNRDRWLKILDQ